MNKDMNMQHGTINYEQSQFRITTSASTAYCRILVEQRIVSLPQFKFLHTSLMYKMYGHMQHLEIHTFTELS